MSPPSSVPTVTSRAARPAVKASAVIVITCAMVASLTLPASAAAPTAVVKASAPAAAVPSAAQAPLAPRSFGNIGFSGVVKAKPVAVATAAPAAARRARADISVSRSTTRAPLAAAGPRSGGVLGIAGSLAGINYRYGGTTPAGFDCSGFTMYVFGRVGVRLPRTAEQQRQSVTAVSSPHPGDLVFFGSPAYHVGIYAGSGQMWDSAKSGSAVARRGIWSSAATYGRP